MVPQKGFWLASHVPGVVIQPEWASALLVSLRKLEVAWPEGRMTEGPAELRWSPDVGAVLTDPAYSAIIVKPSITIPGDIADHSVASNGQPVSEISLAAVQAEGGTLTGPNGLLSAIGHELPEADIDPTCQRTVLLPDGSGRRTSVEVADWRQNTDVEILPGIWVANWVTPGFFGLGGPSTDMMGVPITPSTLSSGGYHDVLAADGTETLVFGERASDFLITRVKRNGPRGGLRRKARA